MDKTNEQRRLRRQRRQKRNELPCHNIGEVLKEIEADKEIVKECPAKKVLNQLTGIPDTDLDVRPANN